MAFTTSELESHLRQCGYDTGRLRRGYAYSDGSETRSITLAGFAYQTYDARDACVAAEDLAGPAECDAKPLVETHRNLGAPVFFVCRERTLEWWSQRRSGPTLERRVESCNIARFFQEHHQQFGPESIYRAKTIGRIDTAFQLGFVDIGLMPVLEERMGQEIARLVKRMLDALSTGLGKPKLDESTARWLFKAAFWLLGAKVLKDKEVPGFRTLDVKDVESTLGLVAKHYGAEEPLNCKNVREQRALEAAADIVGSFASLKNLTVESLAYVYENTLIDKQTRKALGIHATPSYLVDYVVWQLVDWIREIPQQERHVLEPTSGHAPFLVSASRLLREMMKEDSPGKRHTYLKNHLRGVEVDAFAREIARLSLTLADVPHPDGWRLEPADVYAGKSLSMFARSSTILLCNPPFQNFGESEKTRYADIQWRNKATELLARTLPYMREGSVFGVIVPRGFLTSAEARGLRETLTSSYEIREICTLPDNVFTSADHESAVILGRKESQRVQSGLTRFVWVREKTLTEFKEAYRASAETVCQSRFKENDEYSLIVPELQAVWEYCSTLPALSDVAVVGQGLTYKGKDLPPGAQTISDHKFKGAVLGFPNFDSGIKLTELPRPCFMSLDDAVIRRPLHGKKTRIPQVLMNYAPVSRGPWRIKALIDASGHPVTSSFTVVRPRQQQWSLELLWAILNSPLSNAYAYTHSTKRTILAGTMRKLPLPSCSFGAMDRLGNLVQQYFHLYVDDGEVLNHDVKPNEARDKLVAIDAEVMRLYDLPPRLEKQVLDLFTGWNRPGVDFELDRYFPEGFQSCIPLHEYLSEEFQRSTADFVKRWVDETRSAELIEALRTATENFKEE